MKVYLAAFLQMIQQSGLGEVHSVVYSIMTFNIIYNLFQFFLQITFKIHKNTPR